MDYVIGSYLGAVALGWSVFWLLVQEFATFMERCFG